MCLLLFAYRALDDYPLVVAANRDEFHRRPAAAADWWAEQDMLAGRDLEAGGTWFGVNRRGRFAAVTNFRDPSRQRPQARSRGELVVDTLRTPLDGQAWLGALAERGEGYNGFNLVFGDADGLFSYSNHSGEHAALAPGIYGLSNHLLETPWPKVTRGKSRLRAHLSSQASPDPALLLELLADREPAADAELPATGVSVEWERLLSPMFIVSPDYGTRASTVVVMDRDGLLRFVERTFDPSGRTTSERAFQFRVSSG
jgi:uncharacterized protein with NRDE domain